MYKLLKKLLHELNALIINFQKQQRFYNESDVAIQQKTTEYNYYARRLRINMWIGNGITVLALIGATCYAYLWKPGTIISGSPIYYFSIVFMFLMLGILIICKYYESKDNIRKEQAIVELDRVLDQRIANQMNIGNLLTEIHIKWECFEIMKGKVDAIVSKHARHLNTQAVPREDQEDLLLLLELCGSNYYMDMVVPVVDIDNKQLTKLTSQLN